MSQKGSTLQRKDQFVVRFPPGVRKALKEHAAKEERSMNADIVYLIKTGIGAKHETVER